MSISDSYKKSNTKTEKEGEDGGIKIQQLLKLMIESNASDLHLHVGYPPCLRIHGKIIKVKSPSLKGKDIRRMVYQFLNEEQKETLKEKLEIDMSFEIKDLARYRVNVFQSRGSLAGVFRLIPNIIPDFSSLSLPNTILDLTKVSNGIILVTGPTGSGKSTTLASIIDILNKEKSGHIITLEDPIEFIHKHKGCVVSQREVGNDTIGFKDAMRGLLRQDPDIVLVGELRDMETVESAMTIAETGHLVFGTLHTNSCVQTINRIINIFPAYQQDQIRTLLSFVLQGVVSQQLIPKSFTPGRCLALEILRPNLAIRNLIREDKVHQIYSQMQVGQEQTGMVTMNQCLKKYVDGGVLDLETAMNYSPEISELANMLKIENVIRKGA